ncbi:MAG: hypothetical protein ACREMS_07050 [Gemmatimonadaceae bacterium]
MKIIQIALAIAAALPTFVGAQSDTTLRWPIAAGARIRVLSPALGDNEQIGIALGVEADTLVFRREANAKTDTISPFAIKRLDVSTGHHTWKAKGALIGLAIGVVGGAVAGYASYSRPPRCTPSSPDQFCLSPGEFGRSGEAMLGAILLGGLFAATGAIVGAIGADNWTPVKIR